MKKIVFQAEKLRPVLKKLALAVPHKPVTPVLSNLYCRVEKDQVELITSDLDVTIRCLCEAEVDDGPFEILLPFDFIHRVVDFTRVGPVSIHVTGNKVKLFGANDTYNLNALDKVEDYPKLPSTPKKKSLQLDEEFICWLSTALATVSDDVKNRPAITNVLLDVMAEELAMVATDGSSIFSRKFKQTCPEPEQLLLSPRVIKAITDFSSVSITWSANYIGLAGENITVIARRLDVRFPNYKAVIPSIAKNLTFSRAAMVSALERCSLTSDPHVKTTLILKGPSWGIINLQAEDTDYQRIIDVTVEGEYSGEAEDITVNATRLSNLLCQIETETVNMAIASATSAAVLTADEDPDYLGLIMPLKK